MEVMDARRKVWNVGEEIFDCGIFCEIGNMKNGRALGRIRISGYREYLANTFIGERYI